MAQETYTVKGGDTLSGIAKQLFGDASQYNKLGYKGDPRGLQVGTQLKYNSSQPTSQSTAPTQPSQEVKQSVTNQVAQTQTTTKQRLDAINAPIKSSDEIQGEIDKITDGLDIPEAPNLKDFYQTYRDESGINTMEDVLGGLNDQYREAEARIRQKKNMQMGEQVSMDVIGGRVSEIQRQGMDELDFMGRQIQVVGEQLNNQYKMLDTMMNLEQMDYDNALKTYTTKYNERMDSYKLLRQEEEVQFDRNMQVVQFERDSAMANLQIYVDLLSKGTLRYDGLTQESKLMISKLEIQSGLGVGFLSNIKPPPGSDVKSITTRTDPNGNRYADMLIINPDGSYKVDSKLLGREYVSGGGGGSSVDTEAKELDKIKSNFLKALGSPDIQVVATPKQRAEAEKYGEKYQTRETFIRRLMLEHPDVDKKIIQDHVYSYYSDK